MSYKSGSAFFTAFEFAVWKQNHLPLVKIIDYAYQAPTHSILGGPLFASPEPEIKKEEESVLLPELPTLVQSSIDLVYPQVPPFPHVEDYLWPDFSDNANAFFAQFEELEELASYRSESPRLPPVPCFSTPIDQRQIKFFQGWEFEEGDIRHTPPPLELAPLPQVWQEPLPISPQFPPVDLLDPRYHIPDLEQVHQDFQNFYPSPQPSPLPLEEPINWTYVRHRLLEHEIFRSGFSTLLTSSFVRITYDPNRAFIPNPVEDLIREGINLGIEQQGDRHRRLDSRERNIPKRRRISLELPSPSSTSSSSHPPSLPPVPCWHRGTLHITVSSKVSLKFVHRELVEVYRRNQAVQSEIERELENLENQENIPPPSLTSLIPSTTWEDSSLQCRHKQLPQLKPLKSLSYLQIQDHSMGPWLNLKNGGLRSKPGEPKIISPCPPTPINQSVQYYHD